MTACTVSGNQATGAGMGGGLATRADSTLTDSRFEGNTAGFDGGGLQTSFPAKVSWCYTGPGLRLSVEVFGPEYSIAVNSLQQELNIFLSRNIQTTKQGEDFVEKQADEQGLMPIVPDEAAAYGYVAECRHMVECFMEGERPEETWYDGMLVTRLMMHAYKSAEEGKTLKFNPDAIRGFVPAVARGIWKPR